MLVIIIALIVVGLCLGSFVNAFVWRIHEQAAESNKKQPDKNYLHSLSIRKGRSMCPHCRHELAKEDLVPLLSWISLKGRCRYCNKPVSAQYPLVELTAALLFVGSYAWWPVALHSTQIMLFVLWLLLLTGFIALVVYDLRWFLLPNRIIYPLGVLASMYALIAIVISDNPLTALLHTVLAVLIGGGIFYVLFQVSGGKWIGGGDVRLGWLLGLVVGTPARSLLLIFIAAITGSVVSLPLMAGGRLKRTSNIPFGPFLIVGAVIVQLFGAGILHWYRRTFINF